MHFETAAQVALELVQMILRQKVSEPLLLNVNVPDVPYAELRGPSRHALGQAPQGRGGSAHGDAAQRDGVLVGAAGEAQDAGEGTDFLRGE